MHPRFFVLQGSNDIGENLGEEMAPYWFLIRGVYLMLLEIFAIFLKEVWSGITATKQKRFLN